VAPRSRLFGTIVVAGAALGAPGFVVACGDADQDLPQPQAKADSGNDGEDATPADGGHEHDGAFDADTGWAPTK
jgi:hypothetical protein